MKNPIITVAAILLLLLWMPTGAKAKTLTVPLDSVQTIQSAKRLLTRMDEINTMNKKTLGASETRKLRKELRSIKSNLKELDGGTYIPVGSLVVLLLVPLVVFNLTQ